MGTIALVCVPMPSMAENAWPVEISPLLKQTLRPARSSAHTAEKLPFAHQSQQRLAVWTGTRLHQVHAVDMRRLADQPEHARNRPPHVGRLEQQAAGTGGGQEQPLARLQRLVDPRELLRAGEGFDCRFEEGDGGVHVGRRSEDLLRQQT
jgi:hypothetical protein